MLRAQPKSVSFNNDPIYKNETMEGYWRHKKTVFENESGVFVPIS